jgi:hypothetical protein
LGERKVRRKKTLGEIAYVKGKRLYVIIFHALLKEPLGNSWNSIQCNGQKLGIFQLPGTVDCGTTLYKVGLNLP